MRIVAWVFLVLCTLAFIWQAFYVTAYLAGMEGTNVTLFAVNLIFGLLNIFNIVFFTRVVIEEA